MKTYLLKFLVWQRKGQIARIPRPSVVALLIPEDDTDAEIADRLFISVNTVHRHAAQVLAAMDVPSRAGVALALPRATKPG